MQIKEAVVSSARLWENLQAPFRAERARVARLAQLESEREIAHREIGNGKARDTAVIESEGEIARLRAEQERVEYDRQQAESARRHKLEQETEQLAIGERNETAKAAKAAEVDLVLRELALERQRIGAEVAVVKDRALKDEAEAQRQLAAAGAEARVEDLRHAAQAVREERSLELLRARRAIENDITDGHLRLRLIDELAEVARALPAPKELRAVSVDASAGSGQTSSLLGFLAGVLGLAEGTIPRRAAGDPPTP